VHLLFVGRTGIKIAFHVGKKNYKPTMKGKKMYEQIIEQLSEVFKDEFELVQEDLGSIEQAVKEKMQLLGQGLLQRLVDNQPNGYKGSSLPCRCGGSKKFVQHRSRDIHTLFGWIKVKRSYYHCPQCGDSLCPYDKASGLGGRQLSPGLAQACCLLTIDDSFQQASEKVEQLFGQSVSDDTIKQVVHQVGSTVLAGENQELESLLTERQIPAPEAQPERLYVSVDGTTVHETDAWHESKVGCIYWQDKRFNRHRRYIGCFDRSETFGWRVWLQACKCGLRQAKEVVYIGDGAPWIRTEHRRHFGRATFIIDWYHGSEHVWDCGKKLFGEGTTETEDWVKERLDLLWEGCTKKLLDDLTEQHKKYRGVNRDAIGTLIRYISNNEEQMRYDVFRSKGYDIGSGAVEAACKYVVGKRLKQSGMIWSRQGSSATLALRITWLNGKWEQLWKTRPLAA
jgi:hypothetical protein